MKLITLCFNIHERKTIIKILKVLGNKINMLTFIINRAFYVIRCGCANQSNLFRHFAILINMFTSTSWTCVWFIWVALFLGVIRKQFHNCRLEIFWAFFLFPMNLSSFSVFKIIHSSVSFSVKRLLDKDREIGRKENIKNRKQLEFLIWKDKKSINYEDHVVV